MMAGISVDADLWATARSHLDECAEQIGFFLADWSPVERSLIVTAWRPIHNETAGTGDRRHVVLSDETRAAVIQWSWAENACLIEAHSHGRWNPASFSPFDLRALAEWVPHLWWRLQGRPYAAVVTSTTDLDAIAWIHKPHQPEQVPGVTADRFLPATRATLPTRREGVTDG